MTSLAIRRFADRLDTLYGKTTDAAGLALGTGDMLRSVLALDHVLEPAEREPDPNRYRQHILHIDPAGRFSIVALVWLPGQGTPIHDHLAWCVAGVLTGDERELRYRLTGEQDLCETATLHNVPGDVSVLTSGPDIHSVVCTSDLRTISIHVYGADISSRGTSVNRIFDAGRVSKRTPT
ncbi:MAG TPA: cysteine dioxygenase family protein [Pseudonocardiaceae bacterium]